MLAEIYKVQSGESIYDLGIKLYGDVSFAGRIVTDNNLSYDVYPLAGTNLIYYPELKKITPPIINTNAVASGDFIYIDGLSGQSIYDICQMGYGSLENLSLMAIDSGIDSLADIDANGKRFTFRKNKINNTKIFIYLQKNKPATININEQGYILLEDGGYLLLQNGGRIIIQ